MMCTLNIELAFRDMDKLMGDMDRAKKEAENSSIDRINTLAQSAESHECSFTRRGAHMQCTVCGFVHRCGPRCEFIVCTREGYVCSLSGREIRCPFEKRNGVVQPRGIAAHSIGKRVRARTEQRERAKRMRAFRAHVSGVVTRLVAGRARSDMGTRYRRVFVDEIRRTGVLNIQTIPMHPDHVQGTRPLLSALFDVPRITEAVVHVLQRAPINFRTVRRKRTRPDRRNKRDAFIPTKTHAQAFAAAIMYHMRSGLAVDGRVVVPAVPEFQHLPRIVHLATYGIKVPLFTRMMRVIAQLATTDPACVSIDTAALYMREPRP